MQTKIGKCPGCGREIRYSANSGLFYRHNDAAVGGEPCEMSGLYYEEGSLDMDNDAPTQTAEEFFGVDPVQPYRPDPIELLRAELRAQAPRDLFRVGDVIRWTATPENQPYAPYINVKGEVKPGHSYTYAAIKVRSGSWFTTARVGNPFVEQVLDYEELIQVLARPEVDGVEVARGWKEI